MVHCVWKDSESRFRKKVWELNSSERAGGNSGCIRASRCTTWIWKRQRNQRSNCQHLWVIGKAEKFQKSIYFCFIDYAKAFDCVNHNKLWKILKEMEYQITFPDS